MVCRPCLDEFHNVELSQFVSISQKANTNTMSHIVANCRVATTGREGKVSFCASLRSAVTGPVEVLSRYPLNTTWYELDSTQATRRKEYSSHALIAFLKDE
jgi:hypothetical protein